MLSRARPAVLALTALFAIAWAPAADAAFFQNGDRITLPDGFTGSPYPSTIAVSGLAGPITDLTVRIKGAFTMDGDGLGFVLQGPQGQSLALLDGGPADVRAGSITFADSAPGQVLQGTNLPQGSNPTFKPADYYADDSFPFPGPGTAYNNPGPDLGGTATLASTFNGTDPNGAWKLFTANFGTGDTALLCCGWSIGFGGYDKFVIGQPRITGRQIVLPVFFPGPGRILIDDATHPFYPPFSSHFWSRRTKSKRKPASTTLVVPNAGLATAAAKTVDLPIVPSAAANRILKRKGKVTLPIRITFGTVTILTNTAAHQTTRIPLVAKRRKR
jgi:hypothetical protein